MNDLAKVGDKVVCKCNGGPHSIISGSSTMIVDGISVARMGDKTSCGNTIIEGHPWLPADVMPSAFHGAKTSCDGTIVAASSAVTGNTTSPALASSIMDVGSQQASAQSTTPHINTEYDRIQSILNNTPAIFDIAENPDADGSAPWNSLDWFDSTEDNQKIFDDAGEEFGIDADMLRSISYLENSQGWYDGVPFLKNFRTSYRPMNVQYETWKPIADELGYTKSDIVNNYTAKIRTGALIFKRIWDRVENPTLSKVASIYNYAGRENVNDYGARTQAIYEQKPWLD